MSTPPCHPLFAPVPAASQSGLMQAPCSLLCRALWHRQRNMVSLWRRVVVTKQWQCVGVAARARSSAAERPAHNRLVAGSNPAEPICQQTGNQFAAACGPRPVACACTCGRLMGMWLSVRACRRLAGSVRLRPSGVAVQYGMAGGQSTTLHL